MSFLKALFLAHGPDFKQGLDVKPFENIELYNLMAGIISQLFYSKYCCKLPVCELCVFHRFKYSLSLQCNTI